MEAIRPQNDIVQLYKVSSCVVAPYSAEIEVQNNGTQLVACCSDINANSTSDYCI